MEEYEPEIADDLRAVNSNRTARSAPFEGDQAELYLAKCVPTGCNKDLFNDEDIMNYLKLQFSMFSGYDYDYGYDNFYGYQLLSNFTVNGEEFFYEFWDFWQSSREVILSMLSRVKPRFKIT